MSVKSEGIAAKDTIRNLIVSGQLSTGRPIDVEQVATLWEISPNSVAEALASLETEGFVTYSARGPVVRPISAEEIEAWVQKRYSLEIPIVEQLSSHADQSVLSVIKKSLSEQREALANDDVVRFLELNADFHYLLADLAGFHTAAYWFKLESARLRISGLKALNTKEKFRNCFEEHEAIVKAIESRNPLDARKAMAHHLDQTEERISAS
ncbi:MAG: GntR family transcriptional regulator [Acidobacteria bacterium OLB17]|nr:MAG: GntR family transcriptional regulator [Acidobacteria bacterium OLB17]MCZ2390327.1 GntR family transcriptional regulator [Acidobacteriota bacterium]